MSNLDFLPLTKNLTYRNVQPKDYQLFELKPTTFFSPFGSIKVTKLLSNTNTQNNITNNNFQIYNQNINIFTPTTNLYPQKKTLVLDLDETLVHSSMTPFTKPSDISITINVKGKNYNVYVLKRPYLEHFLMEMSYIYEIIVFTASLKEYAEPLMKRLDKHKVIKCVLNREHCLFEQGNYFKDLKVINRDIKDLIIIDNNPVSYFYNKENGVPILSWFNDPKDNELIKLIPLLKFLSRVNDVRPIINQIVIKKNDQEDELNYKLIDKMINDYNKFNSFRENYNNNYNSNFNNDTNRNNLNDKLFNFINNHNQNIKYYNIEQNINNNNEEKDNNNKTINNNIIKKIYIKKLNIDTFKPNILTGKNKEKEKANININNILYKQKDINNTSNNNINNKTNNNFNINKIGKINNINGVDNNEKKAYRIDICNMFKNNYNLKIINKENESNNIGNNMNKMQRNNNYLIKKNNSNNNLNKEIIRKDYKNVNLTPNQTDKKVIIFSHSSNNFLSGKPEKNQVEKLNATQNININSLNNIYKNNYRTPIKNTNLYSNSIFKKMNEKEKENFNILPNGQKVTNDKSNKNNPEDINEIEKPKVMKIPNDKSDSKRKIILTSNDKDKNHNYFPNKSFDENYAPKKTERSPMMKRMNYKIMSRGYNYRPETQNTLINNIMNCYKKNSNKNADNGIMSKKRINIKINNKINDDGKIMHKNLKTEIDISKDKRINTIKNIEVIKSPRKEKLSRSPDVNNKIKIKDNNYTNFNGINKKKLNNVKVKKKDKGSPFDKQEYLQEKIHINN